MDRVKFARVVGRWLLVSGSIVWLSGPIAAQVLPLRTTCESSPIACAALAAMLQHATGVMVVAMLAFVLLRLCYRRIADTGLQAMWQLAGVLPFWLCCREITNGALSGDELRQLRATWPAYTLPMPVHLMTALAVSAVIGLIPGKTAVAEATAPGEHLSDPFSASPAALSSRP